MIKSIPKKFDVGYVEQYFSNKDIKKGGREYIQFHKYRYLYLLNIIAKLSEDFEDSALSILDIGPRFQTNLIRDTFPKVHVNSMGFVWAPNNQTSSEYHIEVQLNETQEVDLSGYAKNQIIIYAEVMEHLYTMPSVVLKYLKGVLEKDGYIVIQTPNGVAADRRIKMLCGQNPYQLIKPHRMNHYREYTLSELKKITIESGYKNVYASRRNYFNPSKTFAQKLNRHLERVIPPSLRSGLTMIVKNEGALS